MGSVYILVAQTFPGISDLTSNVKAQTTSWDAIAIAQGEVLQA